ncbi:MAG: helix-turn-helix transcriptional regulator [Clostridiales bacterium]|nr:helix-turn-helix transcriptional regulator [Clostridiales bacterium]
MSNKNKKSSDILRDNLIALLNKEDAVSMRQLSLRIGASDSYVQKLLTDQTSPSLQRVDAISDFFGLDTWILLCDYADSAAESLEILQLINRLPRSIRPHVLEYMKFLLKQNEDIQETLTGAKNIRKKKR